MAALPAQFAEQPPRVVEVIVKDPSGNIKQLANERVAKRVSHRQSVFLRRDDVLVPKDGQLLRDYWLVKRRCLLKFLHRARPSHEDLQESDPGGMRQCSEELGLERLELTGDKGFDSLPTSLLSH